MARLCATALFLTLSFGCGRTPTTAINRANVADGGSVDVAPADARPKDAQPGDAVPNDLDFQDSGSPDTGVVDVGIPDSGLPSCETGPLQFSMEIASRTGNIFEELGVVDGINPLMITLQGGQTVIVNMVGEPPVSSQRLGSEVLLSLFRGGGPRDLILGMFYGDQGQDGIMIAWSGGRDFVEQTIQAFTHDPSDGCAPMIDPCGETVPLNMRIGDGTPVQAGTLVNMGGQVVLNSRDSYTFIGEPTCDDVEFDYVAGFVTDDI